MIFSNQGYIMYYYVLITILQFIYNYCSLDYYTKQYMNMYKKIFF